MDRQLGSKELAQRAAMFAGTAAVAVGGVVFARRALARLQDVRRERRWQLRVVEWASTELRGMGLEVLTRDQEGLAVPVLERSFRGSPTTPPELCMDWILGPELREQWEHPLRKRHFDWIMRFLYRNTIINGGIALGARLPDGELAAVCLLAPHIAEDGSRGEPPCRPVPRPSPAPPVTDVAAYGPHCLPRRHLLRGPDGMLERLHDRAAPGPHWYVHILAVDATAQGKGLGGKLLRSVFALADETAVPVYLDTCGVRNRAIYEKLGFKAVGPGIELNIPEDPHIRRDPQADAIVRHYALLREPTSSGGWIRPPDL